MVWVLAGIFLLDQVGLYTINLLDAAGSQLPSCILPANAAAERARQRRRRRAYRSLSPPFPTSRLPSSPSSSAGRADQASRERRFHHDCSACSLSAVGFAWAALAHSLVVGLVSLYPRRHRLLVSLMGPFWALPTRVLGGQAAAGGVAIITMVGSPRQLRSGPFRHWSLARRSPMASQPACSRRRRRQPVLAAALCVALPTRARSSKRRPKAAERSPRAPLHVQPAAAHKPPSAAFDLLRLLNSPSADYRKQLLDREGHASPSLIVVIASSANTTA